MRCNSQKLVTDLLRQKPLAMGNACCLEPQERERHEKSTRTFNCGKCHTMHQLQRPSARRAQLHFLPVSLAAPLLILL